MFLTSIMKKIITVWVSCVICFCTALCQQTPTSLLKAKAVIPKDSLLVRYMRVIKNKLGLTEEQSARLLQARQLQEKRIDSARQVKGQAEERMQLHQNISREFSNKVKNILNQEQWKGYKAMIQVQKDSLEARMKRRNIKYQEIKENDR